MAQDITLLGATYHDVPAVKLPKSGGGEATFVDESEVFHVYKHGVVLNGDGTVNTVDDTLDYSTVLANLSDCKKADYLWVTWGSTQFLCPCAESTDISSGDIKFIGPVEHDGIRRHIVFTLSDQSVLTTTMIITFEDLSNKVQSVNANSDSHLKYPTAKAVYDEFQRKPVVVWEVDGTVVTTGLTALETDMSANPSWQLTNLDFSPFKRVKIYTRASQASGVTASASTTPAMILEMSLDERAAILAYGGHYLGSMIDQKSNDRSRLATLCCAISADKTSFACLRMTNLYGTAASGNSDVGGYIFKIEGYYD